MILPKQFPEQNITYMAEGCGDLPAYKGDGVIITAWKLSDEDIEILQKTKTLYMSLWGQGMPPVGLYTGYPFRDTSEYPDELEEKP